MFEKKIVSKEFVDETYSLIADVHDKIIEQTGGIKGIRDIGGLQHSINKVLTFQNNNSNDSISVGAFVYKELARRHHFNDGNKRTAHAFAKIMLFLMDNHFKIQYKEAVPFIIEIAKHDSKVSFNEIKQWLDKHLLVVPEEYENQIVKYINDTILEMK